MWVTNKKDLYKMFINSSKSLKKVIDSHPTSNYGPPYFITKDGESMCIDCIKGNLDLICNSIDDGGDPQWEVVAYEMNWESKDLYCANCNNRIDPEYEDD